MDISESVQVFSDGYLENISKAFKTLFNEEQLSDLTIYCKEGSMKAHKLILAASSPYLCKIFRENKNDYPILVLHGISMDIMKNLIELLYNGMTDVKNTNIEALTKLIRDFEIKGVNFGEKSSSSNVRLEMNQTATSDNLHNRDTRFRGKKRVAVDYDHGENIFSNTSVSRMDIDEMFVSKRPHSEIDHTDESLYIKKEAVSPIPTECSAFSSNNTRNISDMQTYRENSRTKPSAWAKKQRKFKCNLCPSSFKRSSHLIRHQLVHTGERPYSCNHCDKAFSRHDKLKHHIRKTHELIPDSMYERIDQEPADSEPEASGNHASPHQNDLENVYAVEHTSTPTEAERSTSPLFVSVIATEENCHNSRYFPSYWLRLVKLFTN